MWCVGIALATLLGGIGRASSLVPVQIEPPWGNMVKILERTLSLLLGLSAVAIAVVMVSQEVRRPGRSRDAETAAATTYDSSWKRILPAGRLVGNPAAQVTIVEFADLECPFCARFNSALAATMRKHPTEVNYVFVHLPIASHRFAKPAARAAECAHAQGRFKDMVNLVFEKQDSLGLKNWSDFAQDAGVRDIVAFGHCVRQTSSVAMIDAGLRVGTEYNVRATPTVFVNGLRFSSPPNEAALLKAVEEALASGETR